MARKKLTSIQPTDKGKNGQLTSDAIYLKNMLLQSRLYKPYQLGSDQDFIDNSVLYRKLVVNEGYLDSETINIDDVVTLGYILSQQIEYFDRCVEAGKPLPLSPSLYIRLCQDIASVDAHLIYARNCPSPSRTLGRRF